MLPESGDIAWVEFDPVLGTEQAGRRPALVLSDRAYHEASRRSIVCPITSRAKPWSFNVPLPEGLETRGVVLVDQVRSVSREHRMFGVIEHVPDRVLLDVRGVLVALLGLDSVPIAPGPSP
ncbi:type II toxin-antitoxin system PemK/MazF family toxin [Rhodoplanes roseus]|uniref:MazF family transcriptional regulator n=1 Tax=Rhodoplanes roseus TaxID=29409 RepID=A0A327L7J9_9BRAD|nr:type II toxin-antitoxin system PemK/MazF family toxin [Rhodoplanes roseus]RAI46074.1 MazF family transcriptional regulator [Rhodoplanes roseus]